MRGVTHHADLGMEMLQLDALGPNRPLGEWHWTQTQLLSAMAMNTACMLMGCHMPKYITANISSTIVLQWICTPGHFVSFKVL